MSDPFGLGDPVHPARRTPSIAPFLVIAIAAAIAATLVGAAFVAVRRGGEVAGEANERTVGTIDRADDARTQLSLQTAAHAAMVVQAETGTLSGATPEALAPYEPSITFTTDASTGSNVVSVAVAGETWGAAARSASGSCLWVRVDAAGAVSYGAGPDCTGVAALSAAKTSW
jgi:hypothetical protein